MTEDLHNRMISHEYVRECGCCWSFRFSKKSWEYCILPVCEKHGSNKLWPWTTKVQVVIKNNSSIFKKKNKVVRTNSAADVNLTPQSFLLSLSMGCSKQTIGSHSGGEGSLSLLTQKSTQTPRMFAHTLSECFSVWWSLLTMKKWMENLIQKTYILQFANPPLPFNRVLEPVKLSQTETAALM